MQPFGFTFLKFPWPRIFLFSNYWFVVVPLQGALGSGFKDVYFIY